MGEEAWGNKIDERERKKEIKNKRSISLNV